MAQGEGFKHITVTAAEDDDVVIVAGMAGGAGEEPAETPGEPAGMPMEPAGTPTEPVGMPVEAPPEEPVGGPSNSAGEQSASKPKPKSASRKEGGYRETTLEDLNQGPMPLAQRIVIVAAIVCIIGAVIYYFAFMR